MHHFSFSYSSVPESEQRMLDDLDRVVKETGIDGRTALRFKLAVSEAFTNALAHGNRYDSGKTIKIALQVNETGIFADISDEGEGGLWLVSNRPSPGPLAESGRGIDLIEHYTESARFWENERGGLVVSVTFVRGKKEIANS